MSAIPQNPSRTHAAALPFACFVVGCSLLLAMEGRLLARGFPFASVLVWAALAVLAELLARSAFGVRRPVLFSAPFVAAVAASGGPIAAILTQLLALVAAGWLFSSSFKVDRTAAHWVDFAGISAASLVLLTLQPFGIVLGGLGFYSTWFLLERAAATFDFGPPGRVHHRVQTAWPLAVALFAHGIAAITVSAALGIARDGTVWIAPGLMLPFIALVQAAKGHIAILDHYYGTIAALTNMVQRAHPYTHGHLSRVAEAAEQVALSLGLSPRRARLVREAAVLHDIGKIAVDERILDKPGPLDPEERASVERHAHCGAEILSQVEGFSEIATWIRSHHERPDGKGYPEGLSDREIPLESKIIAVVDAFDAMTSNDEDQRRTYREPVPAEEAVEELERHAGSQFDLRVVRAFRETILGGPAR